MKVTADRESMMDELLNGEEEENVEVVESESTADEVNADSIIDQLASVETDLTVEDLRKLPGADKHTDEELEQMWQEALNPPKQARSYKFYKDNAEVEDLDSLSASELLQLQVAYNAMGKEQRRSFDEVIRNAQLGHFNDARLNQIQQQRDEVYKQLQEIKPVYEQWGNDRKILEYALTQYNLGNPQPLEALINAFKAEAGRIPELVNRSEDNSAQLEAAGQKVFYETVVPAASELASRYGADAREIQQAILEYVEAEPDEFMTSQRLQEIINVDLPMLLEKNGYTPEEPVKKEDELASLRKEVAELKAAQKNNTVSKVKGKKPPSAGGGVTPSGGDSMPNIKNRSDMKDYLRS